MPIPGGKCSTAHDCADTRSPLRKLARYWFSFDLSAYNASVPRVGTVSGRSTYSRGARNDCCVGDMNERWVTRSRKVCRAPLGKAYTVDRSAWAGRGAFELFSFSIFAVAPRDDAAPRGPHGFLWFLPRVPVNQIRPIFSNSDRNLAAHGDSGLALVYVRGHGTRTSHNHRYGPDLAVTSHGWLLPRATACCTMILPPSKAGNRTTARGRVTSAPPAP